MMRFNFSDDDFLVNSRKYASQLLNYFVRGCKVQRALAMKWTDDGVGTKDVLLEDDPTLINTQMAKVR